jgi:hypothetical protein
LLALLSTAACGGGATDPATNETPERRTFAHSADDFSVDRFDQQRSFQVVNPWFPLRPGTQYVFEGSALDDGDRLERRVVSTVTDLTKEIDGVRTAVLWERDYEDGELVEAELAFFAQDADGTVWHLGEYPEEYSDGEFDKAPAWLAGVKGATAGIAMLARPRVGTPDYAQGFAPPPVNWVDRGRVYRVGASTCVPFDCYDDVIVIEEFETGKPDAFQLKYYARDLGGVRVGWRGAKEKDREVLELVDFTTLDARGLARARRAAYALERHAYHVNDAYATTTPLQRLAGHA